MGQELTLEELERRWAEINARPAEEPTAEDLAAFAAADAEDPAEAVTLEEYKAATDPFYSKSNQARIRKAIARLDSGFGVEHGLIETTTVPAEQMTEDAGRILEEFADDYDRMKE